MSASSRSCTLAIMKTDKPLWSDVAFPHHGVGPDDDANRVQTNVARWYGEMAPYWTTLQPLLRRRLVLRVHEWIAESAFVNGVLRLDVTNDLGPGGLLTLALADLVPPGERQAWQPWIRATLRDLRLALGSPPALQTEAWWQRLFLGPSYMQGPGRRRTRLRSV
jgi:hypothetical protein